MDPDVIAVFFGTLLTIGVVGGVSMWLYWRRNHPGAAITPLLPPEQRQPAGVEVLELAGVAVTVTTERVQSQDTYLWQTRISAPIPGVSAEALRVVPEGLWSKSGDFQTRDPQFDGIADVRGDAAELAARLDGTVRPLLSSWLMREAGTVEGGSVALRRGGRQPLATVRALAEQAAQLALTIGRGATPQRLAEAAEMERDPGARRRCVALLLSRFPDDPHAASVAALPATREDPWLAALAAAALAGLRDEAELDAAVARLLAADVARGADAETARALVAALDRAGRGEAALVWLLEREDVRLEAIAALATMGGVTAVEPLLAWTRGLRISREVRDAARAAVARIQSRLGDADTGRLSLTSQTDGELTLANEEDGVRN